MLRLNLLFFSTLKMNALSANNNEQNLQELHENSDLLQLDKCAKNWSHWKYSNKEKTMYRKCNMSGKLKLKPNLSKIDSKKSVKCWLKSKSKTFFEKN